MKKRVLIAIGLILLIVALASLMALLFLRDQYRRNLQLVEPPEGAQLLIFPMSRGRITAGYHNQAYYEKNNYHHYGIDITGTHRGLCDILASGNGLVLATEFCDNSLGHIAVIRYDDVYIPHTGETMSLVARYYHMATITIEAGDRVSPGQVIGAIDTTHRWHNHIHLELDADLDYPFNTLQVAETSSALLNRFPATGDQIIEPIWVLALGKGQRISAYPLAACCTEKDVPAYRQS